jgi:uncharacterized membrane protein YgcG
MTRLLTASTGGRPSRRDPSLIAGSGHRIWAGSGHRIWAGFRALFAVLSVVLCLAIAPGIAFAAGEPRLQDSVTDTAGVLSAGDEARIADALQQLRDEHDVQLFVAFVNTTGDATVTDFARSTAEMSSLGGNDALLLVAVEDRSDALWVGDSLDSITDAEIDAILTGAVEPKLASGDFAGAMIAGAAAVGEAVASAPATAVPATPVPATPAPQTAVPGGSTPPSSGSRLDLTALLAVLLLLAGALVLGRALWIRRAAARAAAAGLDQLNRDANRALLGADEALKDATNDVDFAAAQWGEDEVVAYREAIRQADAQLKTAFAIRQRLDDADPETPPERERMLREILSGTGAARALLDEQEHRFDQLRDLEQAAPEQLAALPAAIAAQQARRQAAGPVVDRLEAAYAPSAIGSVSGNLAEADKALASAAAEAERGRSLVDAQRHQAVIALRRSQDGIARATLLLDAIERLAQRLDDAAAKLPGDLEAAAADVATARSAVTGAAPAPAVPASVGPAPATPAPAGQSPVASTPPATAAAPTPPGPSDPVTALAEAERLLAEARHAAEADPPDPLTALERATSANQAADAIIAGIREAEAQRKRRLAVAATAVTSARGHVDRAVDYITTRRHGVGRTARTRAAEAEASVADAERLAATDPDAAVAAAQRATQLADEAYRLAASEFDAWDAGRGPVAGPYRQGGSGGSEVVGAVLGGIIGGILANGGRGSGWGGTPWGGHAGGARGGGGFGFPSGPFGGGRVGGGGFNLPRGGGGGGRVRGGRW